MPMPFRALNDKMGVPLRFPPTPASASTVSSNAVRDSATLGGLPPICRCRLGGGMLLVELTVEVFEEFDVLREPFILFDGGRLPV